MSTYLHEVETHGDQGHAEHEVDRAEHETELEDVLVEVHALPVDLVTRYQIPKADGAQRYETEVGRV